VVSTTFALLLLVAIVLTARYVSVQSPIALAPRVEIPKGAAERLAGAIRIRTISTDDRAAFDAEAFRALHAYRPDLSSAHY
jgi:hypothetical protein